MPDTIYLNTPEDVQHYLDSTQDSSMRAIIEQSFNKTEKNTQVLDDVLSGLPVIIFFVLVLILIAKVVRRTKSATRNVEVKQQFSSTEGEKDFYFYKGTDIGLLPGEIEATLQRYFPYYNNLQAALQPVFVSRLKQFMQTKIFVIPSTETYKAVPVLLSATAAQLTFGLNAYTLPWYKYVCIHSAEYLITDKEEMHFLAGHVEKNIITLAWNRFLNGIENDADGANVGLHELAHALYFQEVVADKGSGKIFINELRSCLEIEFQTTIMWKSG
ncbi:hypothetical protein BH11BAC6_BH11BAC6_05480 [soil metagenome]